MMNKETAKKKYEEEQRRRIGSSNFTCSVNDNNFLMWYAISESTNSYTPSHNTCHTDSNHNYDSGSSSYDSGSCSFD